MTEHSHDYNKYAGIGILIAGLFLLLVLIGYSRHDIQAVTVNASVSNIMGPFGAWIAHHLRMSFGYTSALFCVIAFCASWQLLRHRSTDRALETTFALTICLLCATSLLHLLFQDHTPDAAGGVIGLYLEQFFEKFLGRGGAWFLVLLFNAFALALLAVVLFYRHPVNGVPFNGLPAAAQAIAARVSRANARPLPMNTLADDLSKPRREPWITREKVLVKGRSPLVSRGPVAQPDEDPFAVFKTPLPQRQHQNEEYEINENSPWHARYNGHTVIDDEEAVLPFSNDVQATEVVADAAPVEPARVSPPQVKTEADRFREAVQQALKHNRIRSLTCEDDVVEETTPAEPVFRAPVQETNTFEDPFDDEPAETLTPEPATAYKEEDDQSFEEDVPCQPEPARTAILPQKLTDRAVEAPQTPRSSVPMIPVNEDYIIPIDFLTKSEGCDHQSWQQEIERNSELLVKTLRDFSIESRVVRVNRGPVITLYELEIAPGIKVNRIVGLSDDIAMALAATRVRIVAPIPGKSAIGVEVPNRHRELVTLGDIINTNEFNSKDMVLKVALGQDILGHPVMLDLKKQPHLLIAGATGAGKSVCVNTLITSLVYANDPAKVRFIMVDPKMVELQLYNGLPHLLTPVITEPDIAPRALKWAIVEMERRYRLLSELATRDIERYNQKIATMKYDSGLEPLPYIVIIVDELADLMMVASKDIENYITRIAQKARAVGIHLVLATQRPSVDVITGIIKANFPARIAFQVAQKTDSRTIIDQNGAEKLLGKGDLLYQSPMSSFPIRIQGAFISEDEIIDVVRHAQKYGHPHYIDIEDMLEEAEPSSQADGDFDDELFVEALKIVEETRKASASYLQRRLSIGYNRAARMIEKMEDMGYIGPQQGSKPREVFV